MSMSMSLKPILRPLDFQPVTYQGQQMWLLRDPLELTNYQLILPPALAPMLLFCDGKRDLAEIHAAFCQHIQMDVDYEIVSDTISQLNQAALLDNEYAQSIIQTQLAAYRAQPHRPAALAGLSYPADPAELAESLDEYSQDDDLSDRNGWHGRGLVSPHIDYERGGPVYAKVWRRAATAVENADLVLIFGTDHNGGPGAITLTQQPYATPWGVIPTDGALIEKVAQAIGPGAFTEELHHRKEHSIELSAVWLHYLRRQNPCPMIPILCGSFHNFVSNGRHPAEDTRLTAAIEALQEATAGRNVLAVASVDLAHVGPHFNDEYVMDKSRRTELMASDGRIMQTVLQGDAAGFYEEIASVGDRNRICGFSSIYLMLRFLGPAHGGDRGVKVAYEHCPADPQNHSLVSICGLLLE